MSLIRPSSSNRSVRMLVYDRFEMLDAMGPLEAFATAAAIGGGGYTVDLVSCEGGMVHSSSGLAVATTAFRDLIGPAHTFLVSGGSGAIAAGREPVLLDYIRQAAVDAARVASICTGALVLAKTGLLDGCRVATHWNWCDQLSQNHPEIFVERDPIFVRSGKIWTSAGVTAGIDLALAMIEEDHGAGLALKTARELVVYLRRPGSQAQFSAELKAQTTSDPVIRRVQERITADPGADLRIETLATIAAMSPRNFSRVFLSETGVTPATFVTEARLAKACRLLETTSLPIEEVAFRSGFGSDDAMRRILARRMGITPKEYRERFGSPSSVPPCS
ncbi:helix-turn-helix domain-containing protein [Ochrobactrum sp. Kaboul]|nr:helix-turn-helix domain-containing protein [Ochrobactrum sp. Kaboul]CAD7038404.1 GlxA family transcriptional regulator [Rhizobium sp. P007]HCJ73627.1 AraC family transcriptional regulator [Agrobacterium sp.]